MSSNDKQPKQQPVEISNEEMDELKRDMRSAQLTAWATQNKNAIIAAVLAVLLAIVGVSVWKQHRVSQRASAATLYSQALATAKVADKLALLKEVTRDYDSTAYGGLARLLLAQVDPAHADSYLQTVMGRSDMDHGIRTQARLDLARLKLAAGDKATVNKLLSESVGEDYEQLRQYLLAEAASDDATRITHLKNARDAVSHDSKLKQHIEQQLAALGVVAADQG